MIYILTSGCNSLYIRLDTSEPVRAFSTTIKTNLSIFQKSKHCNFSFEYFKIYPCISVLLSYRRKNKLKGKNILWIGFLSF